MEDRPYDPNTSEETPVEHLEKKGRQGNFLSQFLAKRFGEQSNNLETDDDDDEESLDKKPKRWHAKFKNFFRNVVPPPENEPEAPKNPPAAELFAWPFAQDVVLEKDTPRTSTNIENASHQEAYDTHNEGMETAAESVPSQPHGSIETPLPQLQEVVDALPQQSMETSTEERTDTNEVPGFGMQETIRPPENNTEVIPEEEAVTQAATAYQGELTIPHERVARPAEIPQPIENETIVERGVGSALPVALVAAEYIGRKRADRKITEAFTKKTDHLEKNAMEARRAHEQLDQLLRQNREQLTALKQERGIDNNSNLETTPVPIPASYIERSKPEVRQEIPKIQPDAREMRQRTEQIKTVDYKKEKEPKPQQIMEQVAQAAEYDVPVERVFERSHEVKDDTTSIPVAGAPSVGSIMSVSQRNRQQSSHASSNEYQKKSTSSGFGNNLPFINDQTPEMYKQAMRAGFTAAIVIIVFGFFAYLMLK